jgi:hypothetical protein
MAIEQAERNRLSWVTGNRERRGRADRLELVADRSEQLVERLQRLAQQSHARRERLGRDAGRTFNENAPATFDVLGIEP